MCTKFPPLPSSWKELGLPPPPIPPLSSEFVVFGQMMTLSNSIEGIDKSDEVTLPQRLDAAKNELRHSLSRYAIGEDHEPDRVEAAIEAFHKVLNVCRVHHARHLLIQSLKLHVDRLNEEADRVESLVKISEDEMADAHAALVESTKKK